jgi:hypothetical protein
MDPQIFTYEDALDACELFVRMGEKTSLDQHSQRMCVESALRELVGAADWNSMKKSIRIHLQATIVGGRIVYAGTAGTATDFGNTTVDREVILDPAGTVTWPSNPAYPLSDWELRLGTYSLNCLFQNSPSTNPIDSTHAQLDSQFYPSQDFPHGQGFLLGLPKYPLPPEFSAGIVAAEQNAWFIGTYIPPDQWFLLDKYRVFTGIVRNFTIMTDPNRPGQQALFVHPCPSVATPYDLQIKAWRRPMVISGKEQWNSKGTVSITQGGAVVTGVGTAFTTQMIGSVIRFAPVGGKRPTGSSGPNPYAFQAIVSDVTDAGTLLISTAAPQAFSAVGYSVSDPCDIPQALWECFKARCYLELAQFVNPKGYAQVEARYERALRKAMAADNPNRTVMGVGTGVNTISRLRDNPNRPTLGAGPSNPVGF